MTRKPGGIVLNLVETRYVMRCGCAIKQEELLLFNGLFVCPVHKVRVLHLKKHCVRCGSSMTVANSAVKQLYCDPCSRIIDQARTNRSHYQLECTIDPGIGQKSRQEIIVDVTLNALIGWEEIQIDAPHSTQFTSQKVQIDLIKKTEELLSRTTRMLPVMAMAA